MCYHLLGANPWARCEGQGAGGCKTETVLEGPTAWGVTDVNRMSLYGGRSEGRGYGRKAWSSQGQRLAGKEAASELKRGRG